MKNLFVKAFATAVFVGATATQAGAQLAGLPVYHMPKSVTGVTFNGDYGRCASGCFGLNPSFVGARVGLGLPVVSFEIGLGSFNTDVTGADKEITFAGKAAVQVFGGPLVPVSVNLQVGAGITKFFDLATDGLEITTTTVPIGVGIGVNVPTPGASIEPWIAPRIQVTRTKVTLGALPSITDTDTNVGGSIAFADVPTVAGEYVGTVPAGLALVNGSVARETSFHPLGVEHVNITVVVKKSDKG
ncbi:MAG: hypothetical protein IH877_04190, partial [Gemmatimonadetes bacterium]|nr:hypothetical protein [Gemmatimonadota bacterium]